VELLTKYTQDLDFSIRIFKQKLDCMDSKAETNFVNSSLASLSDKIAFSFDDLNVRKICLDVRLLGVDILHMNNSVEPTKR